MSPALFRRQSVRVASLAASLGEAYLAKGDKERAREAYRKALAIDPAFPSSKAALEKLK
jgi:predicted negative regulator of RcsB-dependent stress response